MVFLLIFLQVLFFFFLLFLNSERSFTLYEDESLFLKNLAENDLIWPEQEWANFLVPSRFTRRPYRDL